AYRHVIGQWACPVIHRLVSRWGCDRSRRCPGAVRAPRAGCAGSRLAGGHGRVEDAVGLDLVLGSRVIAGWWREEKLVHGVEVVPFLLLSHFPPVFSLDPVSLHRLGLEMASRGGAERGHGHRRRPDELGGGVFGRARGRRGARPSLACGRRARRAELVADGGESTNMAGFSFGWGTPSRPPPSSPANLGRRRRNFPERRSDPAERDVLFCATVHLILHVL
uniref:Uncharacterized protein n=1 Tax=Aegilops tauschii subsp. strangulata TaxID=200361 RepID=A0A453FK81_AEGTS